MNLLEILWPWSTLSRLKRENADLKAKYERMTDRDERGRFKK